MNEVPGPRILGGVGVGDGEAREGSAGSAQQDPGVEGHRSERGAGPGQKGLAGRWGIRGIIGGGWARGAILSSEGVARAWRPPLPSSASSVAASATAPAATAATTAAFLAAAAQ